MIIRDSLQTSLWQDSVGPYESNPVPAGNQVYDVIIVGGGITGISTAMALQESGKKCLVIEAQGLCFGTTGGTTAHLNTLLDTPYTTISKNFSSDASRKVGQATADAITLIKNNADKYGIECGFEYVPAFMYAEDDQQVKELDDIYKADLEAGLQVTYVDQIPIPASFLKAIKVEGQAKFHPVRYVFGLAKAFEEAGGHIIQYSRVTDFKENDPIQVQTTTGTYQAHYLIYATHIPTGVNLLHLRCAPYRSYAMAVQLDGQNYPDGLIYDMYDPYHYYRTQVIDGQPYLIVGGEDHKTGHEENTFRNYMTLEAKIRSQFKISRVTHQWSAEYFEPADGLPYIGHLPQHGKRVFVATGFGGNGMVYSHVAARVLTDMITGTEAPYYDQFTPGRIKPVAGFRNFVTHNADVTKEYFQKLFSPEKLEELSGMATGEGKLVKFEGKKLGVYKSDNGEIFAVVPVCTHMHCDVKWNSAEKSWDCPCHGGRFDYQGRVLTGPPTVDLTRVDIESLISKDA